jgi:MFS family permease
MLKKWQDWLGKRPWWTLAAILAVFWTLGWFGIQAAIRPSGASWGLLVGAVVGGIFYGGFMALIFRRQQAKYGGPSTSKAIEKAVKEDTLPESADPGVWLPLLERKRRNERRMVWVGPIEFALFTALCVYLAVTEPSVWFWWLSTVLFVGLGIWVPVWSIRRGTRIDALIDELKAREANQSSF